MAQTRKPDFRGPFSSFFRWLRTLTILCLVGFTGIISWKLISFYQRVYQPSVHANFRETRIQPQAQPAPATPLQQPREPVKSESALSLNLKPMNVLLVGVDGRPGESQSRSDSMVLCTLNPTAKRVSFLPIPRDTYANVPGYGYTKINHAMFYGDIDLLRKSVSNFFGVSVDRYVILDFAGFSEVVDDLGGLTVNVEKNMDYVDPTDNTRIHLRKGTAHLTGEQVLDYCRFRHDAEADTGRMRRQQQVIKLMADQAKSIQTLPKLFRILDDVSGHLQTDIAPITFFKLLLAFRDLPASQIQTVQLQGVNQVDPNDELWYFYVKEEERRRVANWVRELLREA